MNPLQKLLWFLVVVAGLATAAAGYAVLNSRPQPLPVLGDLGWKSSTGQPLVAAVVQDGCAACKEVADSLAALETSSTIRFATQVSRDSEALYEHVEPPVPAAGEFALPVLSSIGEWSLTAEDGKPFGNADVAGKVWVSDFIFSRCAGACPAMAQGMEDVIAAFPGDDRVRFVSFSVDPEFDKPEVLTEYKARWTDSGGRWRFATGKWVYKLAYEGFKIEQARPNPDPTAGNEFIHRQRFSLVDGKGRMRGTYVYDFENRPSLPGTVAAIVRDTKALLDTPEKVSDHVHDRRYYLVDPQGRLRGVYPVSESKALLRDVRRLALTPPEVVSVRSMPALNAALNGTSFVFLSTGLALILRRRLVLHKVAMTAALVTSLLFLACYVYYHLQVGSVKYTGEGWMRPAYFGVLLSHTILAAVVAPMAIITVFLAWRNRLGGHVAIARYTLPIWMYVSLTGILVYLMLYRLA